MQASAPWFFARADSSRFSVAVVLSLVAHLAVLALVPGMRAGSLSLPEPLTVTFLRPVIESAQDVLRTFEAPTAAIEPRPSEPAPTRASKPTPSRAAPPLITNRTPDARIPRPEPRPEPRAAPTPAPHVAAAPETQVSVPIAAPTLPEPVSATPPVARAVGPPAASLREYEAEASRAISAVVPRRYPRIAFVRAWEGRPVVRVHFRKGNLSATLEQSSGFEALDARAVE